MRYLRLFLSLAAGVALPIVAVGVVHNVLQAGVQTAVQNVPGRQDGRPPDLVAYYVIGAVVAWLCGVAGAWRGAPR